MLCLLSADEQSKTGSTSPPAAKAVTNGPAADLECSTATATETNVAALGLPDEIWPEALGPECYKLVLDLLALTDPNSTSEPRIVEIMNGKYEGAPTTSVSDDDRRLCKEEYERIKCSVADAIRFLHSRQKQIPEASRHLARQIMWRSNRNKALALRRKQLLARDTDMTPEIGHYSGGNTAESQNPILTEVSAVLAWFAPATTRCRLRAIAVVEALWWWTMRDCSQGRTATPLSRTYSIPFAKRWR